MIFDAVIISEFTDIAENNFVFDDLFTTAFCTVFIEVLLFYMCGYRNLKDCIYFSAVNIISNLLLNEFLSKIPNENYWSVVLACEVCVVLLEFALCSYWIESDRKRLFKVLVFTNCVSFLTGVIYYFII